MSHCVIERLERQVAEQKYELEQAHNTIDHQHNIYHQLVQSIELEKANSEQLDSDTNEIYKTRDSTNSL